MYDVLVLKSAGVGEDLPTEIQLAPLGEYRDAQGRPFRVTEEEIAAIMENAAKKQNDAVIDYEHQTLSGKEAPAAGWVKRYVDRGKDGLWGIVEWTEKAKTYLKNKEYRYLSPVLLSTRKDADGFWRPSVFHSAGLTNTPQIDGMVPIVNRFEPQNKKEEPQMKKLLELLGLKPEATEDQAVEALAVLKNKAENPEVKEVLPKDVVEALGLEEGAGASEAKGAILALKQPGNVVTPEQFSALKRELDERKRDELVTHALKEGKITADQKTWAEEYAMKDPRGFEVFVNKAPKVVPMDGLPAGGERKKDGVDEIQALVNKMLGLDKETFEKHNKAGGE